MSKLQEERRSQLVRRLAIVAVGLLALLALLALLGGFERATHPRAGELVFPNVLDETNASPVLRITTTDTVYTLKQSPVGWGLVESGGYPVRADRMELLADAMRTLRWGDVMTRDPLKFDRISLGDPAQDGSGALIEILDENGNAVGSLISGRKDDRIYGRKRNDDEISFRLDGQLPPLYTRQAWLDLDVVKIPAEVIKSIRLIRKNGDSLYLERPAGGGPRTFKPAPPNQDDRLLTRLAAAGPALAVTRFFPTDVKPSRDLTTKWVARHITVTHDALEVDVRAYVEPDGYYVTMRAIEAGNGASRAESINAKAEGWAFKLPEYDWADFAPEIASIVRRSGE